MEGLHRHFWAPNQHLYPMDSNILYSLSQKINKQFRGTFAKIQHFGRALIGHPSIPKIWPSSFFFKKNTFSLKKNKVKQNQFFFEFSKKK